jgi:SAM-dependent methyltransferase
MHPQDHFSSVSGDYAAFRPRYPRELFEWLARIAPAHEMAWDCACGSGQASVDLAEHFARVVATDLSASQLRAATPHPRVDYRVAVAEAGGLPPGSVDVVTVAQALHWLKLDEFYGEVRRVLRPGGMLAVWSYGVSHLAAEAADRVLQDFYSGVVGPFWPPERKLVEDGYRSLPFPAPALDVPVLAMEEEWSLDTLLGYARSWSATARYIQTVGTDPVASLHAELQRVWGDPGVRHRIRWPLCIKAARRSSLEDEGYR